MPLYIKLIHAALSTEMMGIAPIIIVLLIVGLATGIFQAAFQIEDPTFSLLPKTFAMIAMALLGGFGALRTFEGFAVLMISHAPQLVHQPWY
jgi:flagellar biosynthetic protein FliQ